MSQIGRLPGTSWRALVGENRFVEGDGTVGAKAGERHFMLWGKDPHPCVVARVLRRQDEGCFGQVEFGSDGLHLHVGQARRIREHGQGVAAEPHLGEHIDGDEVIERWPVDMRGW